MRKKLTAAALCAALLVSPATAVFPDVTEPQVSEAVELLRQLKVVNGKPDGTFDPTGCFTRAEFCKMALIALDRAEEAQLHQNQVIFPDVTAVHWALGYINAAAIVREGSTPLVNGRGDGSFGPDLAITCGEAVTILMRCLGYADADVGGTGGAWYAGYMAKARSVGLLDGLEDLTGDGSLTRAQAALLFENLLYTEVKGSESLFLESVLHGAVGESQLVLEVKGRALTGGGWSVKTDKASYVTLRADLDSALRGRRCKPIQDKDGNVLALRPDEDYATRSLRIADAEARYVVTDGGEQLLVPAATPVWRADGTREDYSKAYKMIPRGATAVFCFDRTETLVSIYLTGGSTSDLTAVAGEGARPFEGAWSEQPTAVYKNGVAVSLADVKPYDVGTFDPVSGVLELSDRKLTGVFEDASPSPVSPNTVTVMGCAFPVLDCALGDLRRYSLGDRVTLLLDGENRVAGVVPPEKASAKVLGTAVITKGEPDSRGYDTYQAKVTLAWGPVLEGQVRHVSQNAMENAPGRLYAVTSTLSGVLELSTPASDLITGEWDVAAARVGSVRVSPNAAVYDKIPNGPLVRLKPGEVTAKRIAQHSITFLCRDNAGTVDVLVLDDCTGEGYTYGRISHRAGSNSSGMYEGVPASTIVANGKDSLTLVTSSTYSDWTDRFMGLAPSLSKVNDTPRVGGSVTLTAVKGVPRSAFGETTVAVEGKVFPLAANIDQCCFNTASETWFDSLDSALAYSATVTVYYDKAPEQGGKIRIVTPDA